MPFKCPVLSNIREIVIANGPPSFQDNSISDQTPHKEECQRWLTHKKLPKTKQIMSELCIPLRWFCGLLVFQASQSLLVLSTFSSSSPVHWPAEGAASILCVESSLFLLVFLFLSFRFLLFLFSFLSLAIPDCFCLSLFVILFAWFSSSFEGISKTFQSDQEKSSGYRILL